MNFKFIIVFVTIINIVVSSDNATVEYYKKLITDETARAFVYSLPQDASEFKPNSNEASYFGKYDYIIVGAGSAGSVIANRLTEDKNTQVLLLEAGGEDTNFTDIPRMSVLLQGLEFNWNYNSTPQQNACLGLFNKRCPYHRGKVLGGSSTINALMYVRGNRRDYDIWHKQGNPGWSYEDVLPLFKKSEDSCINGDPGYHGEGGYFTVENHKPNNRQYEAFLEANVELGRKMVDYNGKEQMGVSITQLSTNNGRRESTARAFLRPAMNRKNLKILTHSFVIRILVCPLTKTAYGIMFSHHGKLHLAIAKKEIILSAGAIGSPQLLMLSGIGPESHLKKLGIPVIQSLPVGETLQDHPAYFTLQFVTNYTEPKQSLEEHIEQFLDAYGPLTIAGNPQAMAFLQTNMTQEPGYPDIQLIMSPSTYSTNFAQRSARYNNETYKALFSNSNPGVTFSMVVVLLHPKSKGYLKLKSSNPYDYPLINPKFLSDRDGSDIETLYQGIQMALELLETNALKKLNSTLRRISLPACEDYAYLSRNYWYCLLRQLVYNIHHPVGTCKMGPIPATGAVVNHELKVYGIQKLRVADASIMPEIPSGNTNAASVMIGEKAAELIISEQL